MFSKTSTNKALQMALVSCFALVCLVAMTRLISAQPMANVSPFPGSLNKISEQGKPAAPASTEAVSSSSGTTDDSAERSFKDFINSKATESTIIGEIKPNASALELMLLRSKIANTIMGMQEKDKLASTPPQQQVTGGSSAASPQAECYIEVTKVEKVPGKCHRASSGLPICQSENYMTISSECS